MQEKPKVSVSRTRRESAAKDFTFTQADIPVSKDSLASFRASAWDSFQKFSLPITTDEAWRRTDLRLLPASDFKLPKAGAFEDMPVVPEELLKPLTGEQHGGQITLLPGGSQIQLDESLAKKGVVFTDFRTAEKNHADLLAKLIGQIVKPDDGKFAALASALAQNGVLLYVPKNVQVEYPLHSVLWGPGT
ncbi:partial FeS cluster assembly protein SufB, partial [Anaerolineae bacterium]